jgi:mannose-6-phosphate isomerase-like protein (cupin superfamily)
MKSKKTDFEGSIAQALTRLPGAKGERYAMIFQHGSLDVEVYAPRGMDPQTPHSRDEVYFVAAGSGEFVCGDNRHLFGPTDILFAAAGAVHRFEDFSEDLVLWVLFYGPEGGEESAEGGE